MNKRNATNAIEYGAIEEKVFEAMIEPTGYERQTTFYSDLSIAEWSGKAEDIKETYDRIVNGWKNNVKYFTEFVMCLNYKSWEHYDNKDMELSKLYTDLFHNADNLAFDTFKDDDLQYYMRTTD